MNLDRKTQWFLIILVIGIGLRLVVTLTQAPLMNGTGKMNIDECAHWNYIMHIRSAHELPDFAWSSVDTGTLPPPYAGNMVDASGDTIKSKIYVPTYEYYQFPGYHLLQAVVSGGSVITARYVNVILFVISIILIWLASQNLYAIGLLSLFPGPVEWLTYVSNDSGILLASCVLAYALVKKQTWLYVIGIVLCSVMKMQGAMICGAMALWFAFKNRSYAAIALGGVILSLAIFVNRYDLMKVNAMTIDQLYTPTYTLLRAASGIVFTALLPHFANASVGAFPIMSAILVLSGWLVYQSIKAKPISEFTLAASAVVVVFLVYIFTCPYFEGRLLFPAIPFLASNYKVNALYA